jgi:hypothetical protein
LSITGFKNKIQLFILLIKKYDVVFHKVSIFY